MTQSVAASAQESAGASLELTVQSQEMKTVVSDLVAMVGGQNNGQASGHKAAGSGPAPPAGVSSGFAHSRRDGKAKAPPSAGPKTAAPVPEQVIPLEDREYDDF